MIIFTANGHIYDIQEEGYRYTANGEIFSQYFQYEQIELTSEFVDQQIDADSSLDTQVEVNSRVIPPEELPT